MSFSAKVLPAQVTFLCAVHLARHCVDPAFLFQNKIIKQNLKIENNFSHNLCDVIAVMWLTWTCCVIGANMTCDVIDWFESCQSKKYVRYMWSRKMLLHKIFRETWSWLISWNDEKREVNLELKWLTSMKRSSTWCESMYCVFELMSEMWCDCESDWNFHAASVPARGYLSELDCQGLKITCSILWNQPTNIFIEKPLEVA